MSTQPPTLGGVRVLWGIHLLCGEEGIDQYKHRPSHGDALDEMWYFDVGFNCFYRDDERGDDETGEVK